MNLQTTKANPEAERADASLATRSVRVLFDPSRLQSGPISLEPELVQLARGGATEIGFELEMPEGAGETAAFPSSDFIRVEDQSEHDEIFESSRRVKIRVRSRLQKGDPERTVGYHLRIKYRSRIYESHGYPGYEDRGPDT